MARLDLSDFLDAPAPGAGSGRTMTIQGGVVNRLCRG